MDAAGAIRNVLASISLTVVAVAGVALAAPATTERVSVSTAGDQANDYSFDPAVSADGRFVAFDSLATNLVASDTNGAYDVFVRDRVAGTTELVSRSSSGVQGDASSTFPAVSADGRYVAFTSSASNLVPGDTNGTSDVFVRDRLSGTTERVSVSSSGGQGNEASAYPSVSADGTVVSFESTATNLVSGDTNGYNDIFVHDRVSGVTKRVSLTSKDGQSNGDSDFSSLSSDGSIVAFGSEASNLVPLDTNRQEDVFVRDRGTGTTERVSVSSTGTQGLGSSGHGSVSGNGRFVAFESDAPNLVLGDTNNAIDVFVRDRSTGRTQRVSLSSTGAQAPSTSELPAISSNGRYVAFQSISNLTPNDTNIYTDLFVRDRRAGTTRLASLTSTNHAANFHSLVGAISGDGTAVAFESDATNLVAGDTNGVRDIFIRG